MKKISTLKKITLFGFIITILIFVSLRYFFYEVPIITYHRIASLCLDAPLLCVSSQSFQKQMDFISSHRYQVISLGDLIDNLLKKEKLSRRTVVITFDDGFEDNYQQAFPVLKRYGFPATIFVVTDRVGKPGYLTWKQIKQMQNEGIDIGSHTKSHVYLPEIDEERLWQEVYGSKKSIEKNTDIQIDLIAYPIGGYNSKVKHLVKKAGYKGACTTNRGRYNIRADVFALRRIKMTDDSDNPLVMWVKLSGIYNLFRRK